MGIGSFFNAPFSADTERHNRTGWTAEEWQVFIAEIKAIYAQHKAIPMIYGIDTTHGANYVRNATLFPQPLAVASSFNLDLAHKMGAIEAKDSLAAGLPWIFSPVLGIAMQPKWSRTYETFGEDPYVVSQMGVAVIRGIQASNRSAVRHPAERCVSNALVVNCVCMCVSHSRPFS
jgi:beta-glucosidase